MDIDSWKIKMACSTDTVKHKKRTKKKPMRESVVCSGRVKILVIKLLTFDGDDGGAVRRPILILHMTLVLAGVSHFCVGDD